MNPNRTKEPIRFVCVFCGETIAPGELDPCALIVVAAIDRPRPKQKEQTFYCHINCLKDRSSVAGSFYITDPDFSSIGEIEHEE